MHSVFGKINHDGLKHNSLYLGLVLHLVDDRASFLIYNYNYKCIIFFEQTKYFKIRNKVSSFEKFQFTAKSRWMKQLA